MKIWCPIRFTLKSTSKFWAPQPDSLASSFKKWNKISDPKAKPIITINLLVYYQPIQQIKGGSIPKTPGKSFP